VATLKSIVADYRRFDQPHARNELRWFALQRSLESAIEHAAVARRPDGKRFSHQRRIPGAALQECSRRLLRRTDEIRGCESFEIMASEDPTQGNLVPKRGKATWQRVRSLRRRQAETLKEALMRGASSAAAEQMKAQKATRPKSVLDSRETKSASGDITWGTRKRRRPWLRAASAPRSARAASRWWRSADCERPFPLEVAKCDIKLPSPCLPL
jgi:hypothetical protein